MIGGSKAKKRISTGFLEIRHTSVLLEVKTKCVSAHGYEPLGIEVLLQAPDLGFVSSD